MALSEDIPITISVPPQTMNGVSITDGTLDELAEWLERLPGTPLDAARTLRNGLMELNRAKGFFTARFPELELLRPKVRELCARLDKARVGLSHADEEASMEERVAQALQTELATGYRVVIAETMAERIQLKPGGTAESPTGIAVGSCHRALTELGFVLVRALQVNATSPSQFWEHVHQLFRLCESAGVLREPVGDPLARWRGGSRVIDAWLRVVMLGASDPFSLRRSTLPTLYGLLEDWTRLVDVSAEIPAEGAVVLVDVLGEEPPFRARGEDLEADQGLRCLDTSRFVAQLGSQIAGEAPPGERMAIPAADADDVTSHALRTWDADTTRGTNRRAVSGQLEVCIGMSAIHRKMREVVTAGEDVTSMARAYVFDMSDSSPGGYGVVGSFPTPPELRAGELLAVRKEGTTIWNIAVARWIAEGAGRVRVGMELLAPRAHPGAAQSPTVAASGGKWTPVLLVPEIRALRKPASMIAPRGRFKVGETLRLNRGGSASNIELVESLSFAEGYREFQFE